MQSQSVRRFVLFSTLGVAAALLFICSPAIAADPYVKDVCASGCTYSSLQDAIDSITDSGPTRVYTVFIEAGIVSSDTSITTNGKGYITIAGRGIGVSILQASALWFQNVAGGTTSSTFLDLSGSPGVTVTNLSIDARTADPGGYGGTIQYSGVKINLAGASDRILFDTVEIQGITFGLNDASILGGLVEVYNSKLRGVQYAAIAYGANWHIYSSELRAVNDGGTSGQAGAPSALWVYSNLETTVWGSHLHSESSQANQTYQLNTILVTLGNLTVIGSTTHVKMTTTSIGNTNRVMSAASVLQGTANFIGSQFLYENTGGALSQGRLAGLRLGVQNPIVGLVGCTFRDGGGSGGTSRSDLLVTNGTSPATLHIGGTQVASFASLNGGFPTGLANQFNTLSSEKGAAVFNGSGTLAVTLPVASTDAAYQVTLSSNANETIWVTNKTTTGFTLNSSNPTSTASVDWMMMR